MMKFKHIFKISALSAFFAITSCKDLIDIQPQQSIDAATALNSANNIKAAITACYVPLKSTNLYGNRMVTLGDALSDNGRSTNRSGRLVNENKNTRGSHYSHWATSYNAINRINLILETLPDFTENGLTQQTKDNWIGELKFLRALYYFDLVKSYAYIPGAVIASKDFGGVPLILKPVKTSSEALESKPARATIAQVYDAVYADLDDAITKLPNLTNNPGRATKEAAQALYSRVALYRKDYQKCVDMSNAVITAKGNQLATAANYVSSWSSTVHPESLFEVTFATAGESIGVNESLQTAFTTLLVRGDRTKQAGFGDLVPSSTLLTDLGITSTNNGSATAAITARSADVRNQLFEIGSIGRGSPFNIECTKFIGRSGSVNLDNVPVIRVAEMYLNRAEALANLGTGDPLADVNKIRTNRGLTAIAAGSLAGAALTNEILLQRKLEFAFEGLRFFDLKRLGMDIPKPVPSTTVAFTEDVILPGIPTSDIDGNPNLKQNSGY